MTVNSDLLDYTMDHIRMNPNEWDQERWACRTDCGTSYCFAGWAVVLSGATMVWTGVRRETSTCEYRGEEHEIDALATELLGISSGTADALFEEWNDLDQLEGLVKAIKDGVTTYDELDAIRNEIYEKRVAADLP